MRRWTRDDDAELTRHYRAGRQHAAIGEAIGRTTMAITTRVRTLRARGEGPELRHARRTWTKQEKRQAMALAAEGATARAASRVLARTPGEIRRWLAIRGVKLARETSEETTRERTRFGRTSDARDEPDSAAPWTSAQDARLIRMYRARAPAKRIASALGRSTSAIHGRIHRLRSAKARRGPHKRARRWRNHDDRTIVSGIAANRTHAEIAATLRRTTEAVRGRAHKIGAVRTPHEARPERSGLPWSHDDDRMLKALRARRVRIVEIGAQLKRTPRAISNRVETLGLQRRWRRKGGASEPVRNEAVSKIAAARGARQ